VQRRVQRTVLNLEDVVGAMLDGMGDRMTVSRSKDKCLQNQHVQRALQHFALKRGFAARQAAQYTPVGVLLKNVRPNALSPIYKGLVR
jgi:hypothetical protein